LWQDGYRKQKAKADFRISITPVILKKLIETLQHMNLPEFTQILLKAMCLLAFHAYPAIPCTQFNIETYEETVFKVCMHTKSYK
jgi:hypothetical protein